MPTTSLPCRPSFFLEHFELLLRLRNSYTAIEVNVEANPYDLLVLKHYSAILKEGRSGTDHAVFLHLSCRSHCIPFSTLPLSWFPPLRHNHCEYPLSREEHRSSERALVRLIWKSTGTLRESCFFLQTIRANDSAQVEICAKDARIAIPC